MNFLLRKVDQFCFDPLLLKFTKNMVDEDKSIAILTRATVKRDNFHFVLLPFTLRTIFTAHSPKNIGLLRDAEDTERENFTENREIPILRKFPGLGPVIVPNGAEKLYVCREIPTDKKYFSVFSVSLR
jgi:hypothetical protein